MKNKGLLQWRLFLAAVLAVVLLVGLVFVSPAAAVSTKSEVCTTIEQIHATFPESYWTGLDALLTAHPNWKFVAFDTGLTWEECFSTENYSEMTPTNNLLQGKKEDGTYYYPTSWYSLEIPGAYSWAEDDWTHYESGNMYQASKEAIAYCMDPRNFLTEEQIFQFVDSFTPLDTGVAALAIQAIFETIGVDHWTKTGEELGLYDDVLTTDPDYAIKHAQYVIDKAAYDIAYAQYLIDLDAYNAWVAGGSIPSPDPLEEPVEPLEPVEPQEQIKTYYTYAQALAKIGNDLGINQLLLAARVRQEHGGGTSQLISGTYVCDIQEGDATFHLNGGYYNYFNIKASGSSIEEIYRNGMKEAYENGWDTRYKSLKGGAEAYKKYNEDYGRDTLYLQKFNVDTTKPGTFWAQYMQNLTAPQSEARNYYNSLVSAGGLADAYSYTFSIPVFENMPETACEKPTKDGDPNYKVANIYVNGTAIADFNTEETTYTVSCENEVSSADFQVLSYAKSATITVKNKYNDVVYDINTINKVDLPISSYTYGSHTFTVPLYVGMNRLSITCTAENGDVRTYEVTVDRKGEVEYGDVNADGDIDIFDITDIRAYILGYSTLTEAQMNYADVNGDGEVDIFDVTDIRAYILGLSDKASIR